MHDALDTGILTEEHLEAYQAFGEEFPDLASEIWLNMRKAVELDCDN